MHEQQTEHNIHSPGEQILNYQKRWIWSSIGYLLFGSSGCNDGQTVRHIAIYAVR